MTGARQRLGRRAEELAAEHLEARGVRVLGRNVRVREEGSGLIGELDVIGLAGKALVFAEVKAGRTGRAHGPERPALAVGQRKQAQIRRLARAWLAAAGGLPRFREIRFDVVGVTYGADGSPDIEWIEDAF